MILEFFIQFFFHFNDDGGLNKTYLLFFTLFHAIFIIIRNNYGITKGQVISVATGGLIINTLFLIIVLQEHACT